jgi:hypothetical protein
MILGPTARPFVVLGGEFARSVRRRGELVMAFTTFQSGSRTESLKCPAWMKQFNGVEVLEL